MKLWKKNILLLLVVAIIVIIPLATLQNAEFAGADGLAQGAISDIDPSYEPWAEPLLELPSGEIESLLFALQAALGAGVIGFAVGKMTTKSKKA